MKHLNIMIKPASSLCGLRCRYCFYADVASLRAVPSFGMMSGETMLAMLHTVETNLEPGDHIVFAFQGGEPTMAGLPFFQNFVSTVAGWDARIRVSYALQTNGMLLDDAWCAFFAQHDFLVGLSLDLLPDCHDAVRVTPGGEGTHKKVLQALQCLRRHQVEFNILCTLTNQIARHPQLVWKQILQLDLDYVQFTPCLSELDRSRSVYALTPKRYASFYTQLFRLWLSAYDEGNYRSIKLFDDLVNLLLSGIPTACGMGGGCHPQLVVESDGSVYPCDFYCLDSYKLGNITVEAPSVLLSEERIRPFIDRPWSPPALCSSCEFHHFCGGGCRRMQAETCCSGSDTFCGHREFLRHCLDDLASIAAAEKQARQFS